MDLITHHPSQVVGVLLEVMLIMSLLEDTLKIEANSCL